MKKFNFLSLILLFIFYAEAQQKTQFICGTKIKPLQDNIQNILNILDTEYLVNREKGTPAKFPKRVQCGLPGEEWNICLSCTDKANNNGFEKVLPFLADEEHRNWHYKFHEVRRAISADEVNSFMPSSEQLKEWKKAGHIPSTDQKFIDKHKIGGELAGEDFLFMHRQMIKMLQVEQAANGAACLSPWNELPKSIEDKEWASPRIPHLKEKAYIQDEQRILDELRKIEQKLKSPEHLKTITLSQLGNEIEATLHGKLHVLYNNPRNGCKNAAIDNSIQCDDLEHDRSSHVNKYFWKIHGLIDQMIGSWLEQNNYDSISSECQKSSNRCYQWKSTWAGKAP